MSKETLFVLGKLEFHFRQINLKKKLVIDLIIRN